MRETPGREGQSSADILAELGISPSDFIDAGAQSEVFAYGEDRVARIFRDGADVDALSRLKAFLISIEGRLPVATPRIRLIDPDGRLTIEDRLPGTSLLRLLPRLTGERRRTALTNFVEAAGMAAAVTLPDRPYGHVLAPHPLHADTWTGFLAASLDRSIAANSEAIAGEVGEVAGLRSRALALLAAVPERPAKALAHGDYFPGNVLLDAPLNVVALVDFSVYTLVGEPQYDALTAPIFLEMIGEMSPGDLALAHDVARRHHAKAPGAARFYRAHAAFAMADPAYALPPYPGLYPWAIANLKRLAAGDI